MWFSPLGHAVQGVTKWMDGATEAPEKKLKAGLVFDLGPHVAAAATTSHQPSSQLNGIND